MSKKIICLDIGGTKILSAIFDEDVLSFKLKKKTKLANNGQKFEELLVSVIQDLLEQSNTNIHEISAISVGSAGLINQSTGQVIYSPNFPVKSFNLKTYIEKTFNVPFFIGNDANLGLLGEWKYGAGVGKQNLLGIFIGTGIGGGIIINGNLYTGSRHAAGEIGHICLNTEGPLCNCGQRGCMEAYAGKIAIQKEIIAEIERGRKTIFKELLQNNTDVIKSKTLKKALEQKDELAIEILQRMSYYLAAGIGSLLNIFNPEAVILGGGVIESVGKYIIPEIKKYLPKFTMYYILEDTQILKSKLEDYSILYGALALANMNKNNLS